MRRASRGSLSSFFTLSIESMAVVPKMGRYTSRAPPAKAISARMVIERRRRARSRGAIRYVRIGSRPVPRRTEPPPFVVDHRAEHAVVGHLADEPAVRGADPGQRRGEHVDRRVHADQGDPLGSEVVGVDALQRAVPAGDHIVEQRRHAHRRVQRDIATQRRRGATETAVEKENRRVQRAARDYDRARPDAEWTRRLAHQPAREPPVDAGRATAIRSPHASTSASEMTRAPWSSAFGRYDTSTDILAPLGQPKLQRALPMQPLVLRRSGAHRNAEPLGSSDELLGPERAHLDGDLFHFDALFDLAVHAWKRASEKSTRPRSSTHCVETRTGCESTPRRSRPTSRRRNAPPKAR